MRNFGKADSMGILLIVVITLAMLAAVDMAGLFDVRGFADAIMAHDLWSIITGGM